MGFCCATSPVMAGVIRTREWPLSRIFVDFNRQYVRSAHYGEVWEFFWSLEVARPNQVGRPWMLEGNMLRGATGMPIRSTERANSSLALAEPDPLTLANRTTKSFTLWIGMLVLRESYR